jgi:hypothetical protein
MGGRPPALRGFSVEVLGRISKLWRMLLVCGENAPQSSSFLRLTSVPVQHVRMVWDTMDSALEQGED